MDTEYDVDKSTLFDLVMDSNRFEAYVS